jgi:Ca-activated chloride channel homolog
MKSIGMVLALAVASVSMSTAAAQDLPSAPSAVINKPKEQPAPPPQPQEKPADIAPPADTESAKPANSEPKPVAAEKGNDTPENTTGDVPLIRTRAEEVNVIFTVTDKRGRFIKDLKRDDLKILDNRLPPEKVSDFSAQTNLPLRVGMLIDASSSVRDRFKFEQEAANEFLHSILRPKEDKAFVLSFDSTREVTAPMTNSTNELSKGIRMIRPGGGTALYDAIFSACRDILMKQNDKVTTRRAIILLSDGDDNQSRVTREEAIEMAQRAEVIVYTISTDTSNSVNTQGEKILQRLSEATGGRHFRPFNLDDVSNAFTDIQDELRSQYAVAYKPSNLVADGAYRTIDIETPNKKYKVRARKGYFAPKTN